MPEWFSQESVYAQLGDNILGELWIRTVICHRAVKAKHIYSDITYQAWHQTVNMLKRDLIERKDGENYDNVLGLYFGILRQMLNNFQNDLIGQWLRNEITEEEYQEYFHANSSSKNCKSSKNFVGYKRYLTVYKRRKAELIQKIRGLSWEEAVDLVL